VLCRVSNVDITSRSCELSFGARKRMLTGREANEIGATAAAAGIPSEGAAGSSIESISKLRCTIDPNEIMQKAGGRCAVQLRNGTVTARFLRRRRALRQIDALDRFRRNDPERT
jgi:hypothetical protein